jgi:hypothetical protein
MQLRTNPYNMKVYILILLMPLISPNVAKPQAIDWQAGANWRLYDTLPPERTFNIDSINTYRYIDLNQQAMRKYLENDTLLATDRTKGGVIWMGFYRVSCEFPDTTRILIVSKYGGFFADLATKRYYQIQMSNIPDWNAYIDNKFSDLHKNISP